jgi:hypothetical protein
MAVDQEPIKDTPMSDRTWLAHLQLLEYLKTVEAERDEALNQLDSALHSVDVLEKRVCDLLDKIKEQQTNIGQLAEDKEKWVKAFSVQSRKLQVALDVAGDLIRPAIMSIDHSHQPNNNTVDIGPCTFSEAFAKARGTVGVEVFEWNGALYHTRTAEEDLRLRKNKPAKATTKLIKGNQNDR